jgi:hypothetical protein
MVVLYIYIYIFFFYIYIYIYIYVYIYVYVYIRRPSWTGSRVNLLTKIPKYPPKCFVRKLFTLLGFFRFWGVDFFDFLESKNIFNPCLYIEFNTQNPNPILKITIPFTKTPKKPKHFRKKRKFSKYFGKFQKSKMFKNPKFYFAFSTRSTIHIFKLFFIFLDFLKNKIMEKFKFQKLNFLFGIMYTFHNS